MQLSGTFVFSKPLSRDGGEILEVRYDFGALTAQDFIEATRPEKITEFNLAPTLDSATQFKVFCRAVMCETKSVDEVDLRRMSFLDAQKASVLARNFMASTEEA